MQRRFSAFPGSSSIHNRTAGDTVNTVSIVMTWTLLSFLKLRTSPVSHCSIGKTGNKPKKSMPDLYTGILSNFIRRPKNVFINIVSI